MASPNFESEKIITSRKKHTNEMFRHKYVHSVLNQT